MTKFADFMRQIQEEAEAEGPEAVAELEALRARYIRARAATVWCHAFDRWALAYFGPDRWLYQGVDRDWVKAYKTGFRAGWRARGKESA